MKQRILTYSLFIAAIFVIHAAAAKVSAQEITGGYGEIKVTGKDAKSASRFAVRTRSAKTGKRITLIRMLKEEEQVVAGSNLRICMRVRDGKRRVMTVTAIVYQNLKNVRSLSKWKSGGCSDL